MSSSDITLMREITCSASSVPGIDSAAVSTPSTRYLIDRPLAVDSRCTSLAPAFSASYRVELTSLTTVLSASAAASKEISCAPPV